MIINVIQVVTERYMVQEDETMYFTLNLNVKKQGEGT